MTPKGRIHAVSPDRLDQFSMPAHGCRHPRPYGPPAAMPLCPAHRGSVAVVDASWRLPSPRSATGLLLSITASGWGKDVLGEYGWLSRRGFAAPMRRM